MKILRNICLVDTPYALSIYLLKMPMEEIHSTMFFVGEAVNINIATKLPHYVLVKNQSVKDDWKYMSWLRIYKYLKCWSYSFARIYIQDHLYISSQFIGPYKYINLPDGPQCYGIWEKGPYKPQKPIYGIMSMKSKIKMFLSRGNTFGLMYGSNDQCVCRWVTSLHDIESIYIKGKNYEYIDAAKEWRNATQEKQEFMKKVFNISEELMRKKQEIDTLILTQPLREDCGLTDEEMYNVYAPYILDRKNVVIKTHPRDKFDWIKYFPYVHILDTYAPMQLLNYIGMCPKEAVTVCSTSISDMPENVKKTILGTNVHPKIYKTFFR